MAVDRSLKMAVKPVAYHHDIVNRCSWHKLPDKEWWIVSYKGKVFAEMWVGKSGSFGLLYTKTKDGTATGKIVQDKSLRNVELMIVGALFNGRT